MPGSANQFSPRTRSDVTDSSMAGEAGQGPELSESGQSVDRASCPQLALRHCRLRLWGQHQRTATLLWTASGHPSLFQLCTYLSSNFFTQHDRP